MNAYLIKFKDRLLNSNISGRILVPFCGKTLDMKFLYGQGLSVIGIECSEKAVTEFFKENNFTFTIEDHENYKIYTHNDRLKIFQGDFYALTSEIIGGTCNLHWDCGALIASDYADHQKYIDHVKALLSHNSVTL